MSKLTKIILGVVATIIIIAVSAYVVYYSNTLYKKLHTSITLVNKSFEKPTIIIVPIAEHGLPDYLNLVFYYCAINRTKLKPFEVLLKLYYDYREISGSKKYVVKYPNVIKLAQELGLEFNKTCIKLRPPLRIVYTKVPIGGGVLYASFINCSEEFYKECLSKNNKTTCQKLCVNYINSIVNKTNINIVKAVYSTRTWYFINLLLSRYIVLYGMLGTPEIVYLNTRTGSALIYLGLQIAPGYGNYYLAVREALENNTVPLNFAQGVKKLFLTCLEATYTGNDTLIRACFGGANAKTINNTKLFYIQTLSGKVYLGAYITGLSNKTLNTILTFVRKFGFIDVNGSSDLYVIMFVSPTCPFCKTEILSLIKVGVLKIS